MPGRKTGAYGPASGVDTLVLEYLPIYPPTPDMIKQARANLRSLGTRDHVVNRCGGEAGFTAALTQVLTMLGLENPA